jgi:predicted DNA-binding protein
MPSVKHAATAFTFRTTDEIRTRLEHHAARLGADMNDIVREATIAHLAHLDSLEMEILAVKRARQYKAPGLGRGQAVAPEKITKSFRRWAEFLEQSVDKTDNLRRVDAVNAEMRERCASETAADATYDAFKTFLANRAAARPGAPVETVTIDREKTVVRGDTD